MIQNLLHQHLVKIKSNRSTFVLLIITSIIVLFTGFIHQNILRSVVYLFLMWLFALIIDFYAIKKNLLGDFPVRNPKRETIYFIVSTILGMVFLFVRFSGMVDWDHLSGLIKLAFLPMIIFVFPIGLAIILLLLRYKLPELGFRFQGLILVLPILLISAATNQLLSPESLTWDAIMAEEGTVINMLFSGLITAGLSEEFFRMVAQTRLGALLKNPALGWFLAATIWAFLHAPKWYFDDHNLKEAILGSIRIIPIGLMWSYITYRTKSILPSVIVHGFNFWGLQNF